VIRVMVTGPTTQKSPLAYRPLSTHRSKVQVIPYWLIELTPSVQWSGAVPSPPQAAAARSAPAGTARNRDRILPPSSLPFRTPILAKDRLGPYSSAIR
jgi:hypothetical protein